MALKSKIVAPISPKSSTALIPWEEQLAKDAEASAGMEANAGGGQFFSARAGQLSWQGGPVPNNQMAVVILDSILENIYYEGDFDPDNVSPPTCFAFGRDEATQAPHAKVFEAKQEQSDLCKTCEQNEYGSASKGRGKACRNTRRIAVIPAGTLDISGRFTVFNDDEQFQKGIVGYFKPPVTSIKAYASFVQALAATTKRPPHGVFTRVRLEPDPKNQYRVIFEPLGPIPNNLMPIIMERRKEVMAVIEFPYSLDKPEPREKPEPRGPAKISKITGRK